MKKLIIIITCIIFSGNLFSQNYNSKQLEVVAKIWGECYLFHPSVIRADRNLNWEQELVKFLPAISNEVSKEEFYNLLNSELLSKLNDPMTCVQKAIDNINPNSQNANFQSNENYHYFAVSKNHLESSTLWTEFDSLVTKTMSQALVLDLRIYSELSLNPHKKSYFERIASLLIESPISLGSLVSREHYGWDEFNDWWYYEQQWKIVNNGILNPLKMDAPRIQYQYPEIDLNSFETIQQPVYFIVNKNFISYYLPLLNALKLNRPNTYILYENTGKVQAPWYSKTIKYDFGDYEFILNPNFTINNKQADLIFDYSSDSISVIDINNLIRNETQNDKIKDSDFSFDIIQKPYPDSKNPLTNEEKILGIIKTWTIVKHFYVHHALASENWSKMLEPYLLKAQDCHSDKEYYELIHNMMSKLNDSHVSTYHPSILDFSKLFVAPVQFEWIENRVIVTAVDPKITNDFDILPGDEILSIDEKSIELILKEQKIHISASNEQSFYSILINPGYFINSPEIPMKLSIKREKKVQKFEVPRTTPIYQFMGFGDNRPAFEIKEGNIGYLNLSVLTNSKELEKQLREMKNTKAIILDLRNGYPTDDYSQFIEMLANNPIKGRIEKTPIIFANKNNSKVVEESQNEFQPDSSFIYKNPIAVLIDKSMVSRPEDIAIQLKQIENLFFVGEQTQGTDGEMTKISLPGGGETSFTGQIIKFANGDQFQGIGITPDYKVEKTIKGVKEGKDEILEQALKIISKKISQD